MKLYYRREQRKRERFCCFPLILSVSMPIPNTLPATILIHDTSSSAGYVNINDTILLRYIYQDLYSHFYNNCTISRALIGGQLCSIRVKNRPWKRCDGEDAICFSLPRMHCFPRNFNRNGHQNCQCYCKKQISNSFFP